MDDGLVGLICSRDCQLKILTPHQLGRHILQLQSGQLKREEGEEGGGRRGEEGGEGGGGRKE